MVLFVYEVPHSVSDFLRGFTAINMSVSSFSKARNSNTVH